MLQGTIIAAIIGVAVYLIRVALWKNEIPSAVRQLRYVLAFGITILAIAIQIAIIGEVKGYVYILNGVLFLAIAQVLSDTNVIISRKVAHFYYCPNCKNKLDEKSKFCIHCGTDLTKVTTKLSCLKCGSELKPENKFCPECGTAVIKEQKKDLCPNCNNKINENQKFCVECGTRLIE